MPREVIESVKIVIKTPGGHRLEASGKVSATSGMLAAFICLPQDRREWLMRMMAKEHEKMLALEASAATPPAEANPNA